MLEGKEESVLEREMYVAIQIILMNKRGELLSNQDISLTIPFCYQG
jgi:hypothetical protein